jgi:hypothetical protein
MSTFPALIPSTRTFTPGDVPNVKQVSLSGMTSGFRRGNRRIAQGLSLSFQRLTQVQLDLITAHYVDRQGSFDIFYLSPEVWSGYTTPPVPLLSDFAWQYAGAPSITDSSCGRWEVEVDLQTIPIDLSDLVFDGEGAPAAPSRLYVLDAGGAAASPARDYIISPTGAT